MSLSLENLTCNCDHGSTDAEKYAMIAQVIDAYKDKEGSLIQVLHAAQEIYGYLPLELQKFIALRMNKPLSEVNGVVSFYSFFSTKERGKHTIHVCMGTACYVRGAQKLVEALEEKLGVSVGEVTPDKKFTLDVARCIGACGLAPAVMVDNDVHRQVQPHGLDAMLKQY
ncbi:MAG: NAD(P)H-dependent oxidoreductase subunit E [Ruminiclostridium sp.]|nr:NAD(P)H-dependent oxidoreductase subunit E [Ruminiclostridium sp.]